MDYLFQTEEVSDKGSHDPKLSDLQNEIIVSPSSIKTNDKEVLKVFFEPEMKTLR